MHDSASNRSASGQADLFRRKLLAVAVAHAMLGVGATASAADITVNDAADTTGGAGCTLRDAITAANTNAAAGGCPAGEPDATATDSILFDAAVTGTITLTSGQIQISSSVTIQGPGADQLTLSGNNSSRHFLVYDSGGTVDVGIDDLTLSGGSSGYAGSIFNFGENLSLNNCVVRDNTVSRTSSVTGAGASLTVFGNGGAMETRGSLTIQGCAFLGNSASATAEATDPNVGGTATAQAFSYGGAIFGDGTISISDSVFSGNSVQASATATADNPTESAIARGGALLSTATLNITDTEISGNSANQGGGLSLRANAAIIENSTIWGNSAGDDGGGIFIASGVLTLTNSTISGNTAADIGGGISNESAATLLNNTVYGNDAGNVAPGIYNETTASISLTNNLIAGNGSADCINGGAISTNLNNFIGDGSCADPSNLSGDPMVGSIQPNGGPTLTHALLPGSPAANAGDNTNCPATDQRGQSRSDGSCDIGAFELGAPNMIVVNTLDDTVGDDDECSLREAVLAANSDTASGSMPDECAAGFGPDLITFAAGLTLPATATLSVGEIVITSPLTIQGPGEDQLTLQAGTGARHFTVNDASELVMSVELNALTLRGGNANGDGGSIYNMEFLALNNSTFTGNTASGWGGALSNYGTAEIRDSTFSNNSSSDGGAAIDSVGTALSLVDSTISSNTAQGGFGGGVYVGTYEPATFTNVMLLQNTAGFGGAIYVDGTLTVVDSTIADNSAYSSDPTATARGGGIYINNNLTISGSRLANNQASVAGADTAYGGGIFNNGGSLDLSDSTLYGNSASGSGGGLYSYGQTSIAGSTFAGNSATLGGGIYHLTGNLTLTNSTLSGNAAADRAGGIFNSDTATLANTTITGNTATDAGRGVYNTVGSEMNLTNNVIAGNPYVDCVANSSVVINVNNFIGDGSCADASNLSGDPLLGPLRNNGGPSATHALLTGSPAINAGANGADCPAADQRGQVRNDGACDIGAFEAAPLVAMTVTTLDDSVIDDGLCSLREATEAANTDTPSGAMTGECEPNIGDDEINFDPSLTLPGTITLASGELEISSSVSIQGPGADQLAVSGNLNSRIFNIDDGATYYSAVAIDGITIRDGLVAGYLDGGAIQSAEDLTLSNSVLADNSAYYGGGLGVAGGTTTVTNTTFSGNTANYGGGLLNRSNATVSGSTFSNNEANSGGAITNNSTAVMRVYNSTLGDNYATYNGGGIRNNGNATLTNNTLAGNSAGNDGGSGLSAPATGATYLRNNIFANLNTGASVDCDPVNPPTVNANNVIVDGSCPDVSNLADDPLLGSLQDNGGATETYAVLPGSPVIDAGNQGGCDMEGITTDQTGMPRPIDGDSDGTATCDIGAFEFVDIFGPEAALASAPNVTIAGTTSYDLDITYTDDAPIDINSIDSNDILVDGPGGTLTVDGFSTVTGVTFTYTFTPPGGAWDYTDNGDYNIALNADEVLDQSVNGPNTAPAVPNLGTFNVAVAEFDVTGNNLPIVDGDTTPSVDDGTDFGAVVVGGTLAREFLVGNIGEDVITISSVSVTGDGFSITIDPTGSFGTSSQAILEISFSPTAEELSVGTVTINNNDFDEAEYTFAIAGNGVTANTAPVADDAAFDVSPAATNGATVGQVNVTDAENNVPAAGAWEITDGNSAGAYAIGDDGTITVADAAALTDATLTVQVTDSGTLSDTATITISVLDEAMFADGFEGTQPPP